MSIFGRSLRSLRRYFGNNDIDITDSNKLNERMILHTNIGEQMKNNVQEYIDAEEERITREFPEPERRQYINEFLEKTTTTQLTKEKIVKTAKENAYVIWDGVNFITCSKEIYDRRDTSKRYENDENKKKEFMLNTLIPRTEITYQELGLLLDGTLAIQIVNEINPDYLKNNHSGLHTIFRLLPIEEIMNFLNAYYNQECSITKSISLLKNRILKLLKKSELIKFSNNNSNRLMVDLVLNPFLKLQLPSEINNYASN